MVTHGMQLQQVQHHLTFALVPMDRRIGWPCVVT
jgi:hypothetical protein